MQGLEQRFPDLPEAIAVHTAGYKLTGARNDPLLCELIQIVYLKGYIKKRFWGGPYVSVKDTLDLKSWIAVTGAFIAISSRVETAELMRLSLPREADDYLQRTVMQESFSRLVDMELAGYVSLFGDRPKDLVEMHWAQAIRDIDARTLAIGNDFGKIMGEKIRLDQAIS